MTRFLTLAAAAVIGLALSSGAVAREPKAPPAAPTTEDTNVPQNQANTRYCVIDTPTGSHIRQKVCKTRAEWMDEGFDPLDPQ